MESVVLGLSFAPQGDVALKQHAGLKVKFGQGFYAAWVIFRR